MADRPANAGQDDDGTLERDTGQGSAVTDIPEGPGREPVTGVAGGAPGASVFTLEGRAAPGLYFVAWLLSGFGLASFFVGLLAGGSGGLVLVVVGFLLLTLGLGLAAGYQVLARADRAPALYRGPSPLLLFGVTYAVTNLVAFAIDLVAPIEFQSAAGFLVGLGLAAMIYTVIVLVFVVRTRALRWREMGWPAWGGRPASITTLLTDILVAAGLMLPVTFGILIFGTLVGQLLQVTTPRQLPPMGTTTEALLIAIAAAFVAPVGEELFFRGFAMSAWWRDLGVRAALIRSTVFFAFVHVINVQATSFDEGWRQALLVLLIILPVGAVLGWLFARRGIAASITGHVTYNGILILLTILATRLGPVTPVPPA